MAQQQQQPKREEVSVEMMAAVVVVEVSPTFPEEQSTFVREMMAEWRTGRPKKLFD